MTAQPEHHDVVPPMRTLAELRTALGVWGSPATSSPSSRSWRTRTWTTSPASARSPRRTGTG
ncbi:hypothetical protein ACFQ2B_40230 [Streptomyces stramineus]